MAFDGFGHAKQDTLSEWSFAHPAFEEMESVELPGVESEEPRQDCLLAGIDDRLRI